MKFIKPQFGTKRDKSGFLLFPKKINRETRWLELASWRETYGYSRYGDGWGATDWLPTIGADESIWDSRDA